MARKDEIKNRLLALATMFLTVIAGFELWLVTLAVPIERVSTSPNPDSTLTLLAVGDIMLGRDVGKSSRLSSEGDSYPFGLVKSLGENSDLVFGNLESPLVAPEHLQQIQSNGYLFPSHPQMAFSLANAGFNIVTLANNHTLDYGPVGLQDTIASFEKAGINYAGAANDPAQAQNIRYLEKNGLKLAFIAATAAFPSGLVKENAGDSRVALFSPETILALIRQARPNADIVILALHWGAEYQANASEAERDFARNAVEAGADVILGAHPHVVGEFEVIKRSFIAYSLGNFVFDSRYPPESRESVALYLKMDKKGVSSALAVPLKIENDRPRPLAPDEREAGLENLLKHSGASPDLKAESTFWNGQEWRSVPALAYIRDASPARFINLPEVTVTKVRDLLEDKTGFPKGVEGKILDFSKEPQTDQLLELNEGRLRVWRVGLDTEKWQIIWESAPSWGVHQFSFSDVDNDGRPELLFSLWKTGGWDDKGEFRSHPFIYGWRRNAFRAIWAGSALSSPIREFFIQDLDGDGRNELIVLEGDYTEADNAPARFVTIWRWNIWGFELIYRGERGRFSALVSPPAQPYVFYKN